MKNIYYYILSIILFYGFEASSQTYTHSTSGLASTFSGGCTVNTCSGVYYDNGGAGGNYSNNINNIYHTYCPDSPGTCLRATFTSYNIENGWDFLDIINGSTQGDPLLVSLTGVGSGFIQSTSSSGCLSFSFDSDGTVTRPGWVANLSCVPCGQRQPDGLSDCTNANQICNNSSLTGTAPGPGSVTEGCAGCASAEGEKYTNWYFFEVTANGALALNLSANNGTDDLDFALYGPNVDCSTLGAPVRCSYAANGGSAGGMTNGAGDNSEGVTGNGWVEDLNVSAGEVYVLMINNWSPGGGAYTINWTGSTSLECSPISLPVDFLSFKGEDKPGFNEIKWETASENDNDYFRVERSRDGSVWYPVATVMSKGSSNSTQSYQIEDRNIEQGSLWYYRIKQTDYDGTTETHDEIVAIMNNHEKPHVVKVVNLLGQEIDRNSTELRIEIYSDGSRVKKMGE
ncbi:MAG: hypothetical protein COA32_04725 [Fluviicola sp.]|nr:MAG: hypothetical protein COA32_04725 [Fluviicola sp.]